MNFLANENFPMPSLDILRKAGFNVISVSEISPGITDQSVIEKAIVEKLIILTFDKDYGEIIFKYKVENPPPVVFFRFKGYTPQHAGSALLQIIANKEI